MGLAAFLFWRKSKNESVNPYNTTAAGSGQTTHIDPPINRGPSTTSQLKTGSKTAVCAAGAAYYTAGLATPVCGTLVGITNKLDNDAENQAKGLYRDVRSGNVVAAAKDVILSPVRTIKSVWPF